MEENYVTKKILDQEISYIWKPWMHSIQFVVLNKGLQL